jgi:hypothetical protein
VISEMVVVRFQQYRKVTIKMKDMSQYSPKSKLHTRIRNFVCWIAPAKETRDAIKKQADEIRSRIRKKAEGDGLTVTDTPYSGSFSTKTGLRRHLRGDSDIEGQDIDLPFVVKKDRETEFEPLIQRFKKYVEESYPNTKITVTKSSVKMEFEGTKLTYDIVPMFATDDPCKQLLIRENGETIKTSIQDHREFVRNRTKETKEEDGVVAFNDMIRLFKWWREHKQQDGGGIILPSFLINLLAAKALDKCKVNTNYPQTLSNWFSSIAFIVKNRETIWFNDYYKEPKPDSTKPWNVLDPVMADNSIVKSWSGWQVNELADWLQEASEIMNRAMVADSQVRDSDSLDQMKLLFGKIFSSHCD